LTGKAKFLKYEMIMVMDPTYSGYWVKFLVHCATCLGHKKYKKAFKKGRN
jgi:hypothetical protein